MSNCFADPARIFEWEGSLGEIVEVEAVAALSECLGPKEVVSFHGTSRDLYEGVDCTVWRERVDITTNPNKDHVAWLSRSYSLGGLGRIRFGYRTGNSHQGETRFENPVLVVWFDCENLRRNLDNIMHNVAMHGREIMALGFDQFYDYQDALAAT